MKVESNVKAGLEGKITIGSGDVQMHDTGSSGSGTDNGNG